MEVEACLQIAESQNYILPREKEEIDDIIQEVYFKLIAFDKYLRTNI